VRIITYLLLFLLFIIHSLLYFSHFQIKFQFWFNFKSSSHYYYIFIHITVLFIKCTMLGRRQRRHPSLEVFAAAAGLTDKTGRDTLRLIGTRRRPATKSSHSAASSSSEAHVRSGPLKRALRGRRALRA
jgi:hypothetical protein